MRKLLYLFMLAVGISTFGQETKEDQIFKVVPPHPEALSFTKYGNLDADEFNGKVNVPIPLYNYTVNGYSIPLSIAYNGTGVKLDDVPTQVGINWIVDFGGIISREVKDIPDELSTRLNITFEELNTLNEGDCNSNKNILKAYLDNNSLDKEFDLFSFKVPNYSGTFYFDENFNPRTIDNENEIKIELIGTQVDKKVRFAENKKILITTPDGIKYYFGGENVEETSVLEYSNGDPQNLDAPNGSITSFLLYEIELPINGRIYFEYESVPMYHYNKNLNYSKTFKKYHESANLTTVSYDEHGPVYNTLPQSYVSRQTSVSKIYIKQKFLKKVSNNINSEVLFFERGDYNALRYKKVLNQIILKSNNVQLKKFDFHYIGIEPLNNYRFFLSRLKVTNYTNTNENINEEYQFIYKNPSLLGGSENFKKIDYLGYFNNQNNTDLFPVLEEEAQTNIPNREPNFEYGTYGVLEKIIYPTKGYTSFEYEPYPIINKTYTGFGLSSFISYELNDIFENEGSNNENVYMQNGFYVKNINELPNNINSANNNQNLLTNIQYGQVLDININIYNYNDHPHPPQGAKFKLTITDSYNGLVTNDIHNLNNSSVINYTFLSGHSYSFKLELTEWPTTIYSPIYYSRCYVNFSLHTGYSNDTGIGIRLKRIKDYTKNNESTGIKRYYYKPFYELNNILVDDYGFMKKYKKTYGFGVDLLQSGGALVHHNYYNTTTTSSNQNYNVNSYLTMFNKSKYITISLGGDNFENGGIQKEFALDEDVFYSYLNIPMNTSLENLNIPTLPENMPNNNPLTGKVLKETTLGNKNGTIYKVSEKLYNYEVSKSQSNKVNLLGYKYFSPDEHCGPLINSVGPDHYTYTIKNYFAMSYPISSFKIKLKDVTEKLFIEPIPIYLYPSLYKIGDEPEEETTIAELIESPYKKISKKTMYQYSNLKGLPTTITSETSNDNVQKTIKLTYVDSFSNLTNLTTEQINNYNNLLNLNRVNKPIQIQNFQNTELLNTNRTIYKSYNLNGINKILPERNLKSKQNLTLENDIVILNYDINGNPILAQLNNGIKKRLIYNTEGLLVAEIENYTGTETNFPLINGNIENSNCVLQNQYPNSFVTVYTYDLTTKKVVSITKPDCEMLFYFYDNALNLQFVKDKDGKVLSENQYHYRE